MAWEDVVTQITNAHQDAIEILDKLEELAISDNDVDITLSDGTTYTIQSIKNMRQGLIDDLKTGDYNYVMSQTSKTVLQDLGMVFFVDSDLGDDSTGSGTYDSPYKTISKAVRSISGYFGVVFLKTENDYHLSRTLTNGSDDIYLENKFVVIDSYRRIDNTLFELGTDVTDIDSDSIKPIVYPQYTISTSDSTKAATIDGQIIDMFKKKYSSDSDISLFDTSISESKFDNETSNSKTRPYFYSLVLSNSVLLFNNVCITNSLNGSISNYSTINPFFNAFENGTAGSNEFVFRPMPAIIKDFHFEREIDEDADEITTINDKITCTNFFKKVKNHVGFRNVSFYLYGTNGSLFYFNNILDTSSQYEIVIENSYMKQATSDNSTSNIYHRYNPLMLLEINRVDSAVSFPFNIYNSQGTPAPSVKVEMFNTKYEIDLKINNFKVSKELVNGRIGVDVTPSGGDIYDGYGFYGNIEETDEWVLPYSFNLFRLIETYRYEYGSGVISNKTFVNTIFSDYFDQVFKRDDEFGTYSPIVSGSPNTTVSPNSMRLLYVPELEMTSTLASGVPDSNLVTSNSNNILVKSPIITKKRITSNLESISFNEET